MGRILGISMVRIRLSELDDAVKTFLARAQQGETIVVEDDDGLLQCGVTPYVQTSAAEKQAALGLRSAGCNKSRLGQWPSLR